MKKKLFFKFFVFTVIAAFVTVISCKDYDDDISNLQQQSKENGTTISALQTQLTALQTAATAAQTTADAAKSDAAAAKTAAAAAQATGDQAMADAAAAKAKAEEAIAAAAQAKADAITEAKAEVAALKAIMESDLAKKVDQSVFDNALVVLNAQIEGIENGLSTLQDTVEGIDDRVIQNTTDIKDAQDAIEALITANVDLGIQLDALKLYAEATRELADDNKEAIEAAQTAIEEAQGEIVDLWQQLTDDKAELKGLIDANASAIEGLITGLGEANQSIADLWQQLTDDKAELKGLINANTSLINTLIEDLATTNQSIADLEERIDGKLDVIRGDISDIQDDIRDINSQILDINGNLASLHTLIVNRLTAITLASNAYVDGIEAIKFTSLVYKPMAVGENTEVPTDGYNMAIGAPALASYKFNPRSFTLANADYQYVDRTAEIIKAYGLKAAPAVAKSQWVAIEGDPVYKAADGTVNFTLRRLNAHNTQPDQGKDNFVALEATLKGDAVDAGETGAVVAAQQELVYDNILYPSDIFISDKGTLVTGNYDAHYPVTFDEAAASTKIWYEIPYDKVYDLLAKVATCYVTYDHKEFNIADYNLTYKFSVASSKYDITEGGTVTNQQDWVELVSSEDGTYKAKEFNKELIGRTPILKVELVDQAGNVVRRAFVKVKFVAEKTPDITVGESHDLVYKCNDTEAEYTITEQYIRDNVYRIITSGKETSMSHEEFWNTYDAASATTKVTKNGSNFSMTSVPQIVDGATGVGTATKKIVWNFTHGELGQIGVNGSQFVASVTVKNKLTSSEFPEYVTFQFTVNVTLPNVNLPAANKVENDQYWSKNADGSYYAYKVNVAVPAATDSPAAEAIFKTSLPQAYSKYIVDKAGACTTDFYKVVATYSNGSKTTNPLVGVQISGTDITLDKNSALVKTALNSAGGLQASVAHIYKLENGEEITVNTFLVDFIRPVNLNMPSGISVKDAKTGGDIADFQWNGILTDWRGEFIVDGSYVDVDTDASFWANTYQPEYTWKDGHYVEVNPASLDVVMEDASFTIGSTPIELFKGTATYQKYEWGHISGLNWGWKNVGAPVVFESEQMLTEDQVYTWLAFKLTELESSWNTPLLRQVVEVTAPAVTSEMVSTPGQVVEYSYVKSVTYSPAEYDWVPGEWEVLHHTPTDMPTVAGTHNGQVIGDWTWTVVITSEQKWAPGQYWDFYGPFTAIKADVAKATTNLGYNENKLPADVTLEQVGNTVKYVNVGTPVGYSYEIYIPVTVTYGWGELKSQLTITVDPVE